MFRFKKNILSLGVTLLLSLFTLSSYLYGETIYFNDFENENDLGFLAMGGGAIGWSNNFQDLQDKGYITINYAGLSEEKSVSGKKSYKLDITLNEGSWCYFSYGFSPKIVLKSDTHLSGYIYVQEFTGWGSGFVKPGINWGDKPSGNNQGYWYRVGGDDPNAGFSAKADGWKFYQSGDVIQELKPEWKKENKEPPPPVCLENVIIGIVDFQKKKRVVIYVDDLSLTSGEEKTGEPNSSSFGGVRGLKNIFSRVSAKHDQAVLLLGELELKSAKCKLISAWGYLKENQNELRSISEQLTEIEGAIEKWLEKYGETYAGIFGPPLNGTDNTRPKPPEDSSPGVLFNALQALEKNADSELNTLRGLINKADNLLARFGPDPTPTRGKIYPDGKIDGFLFGWHFPHRYWPWKITPPFLRMSEDLEVDFLSGGEATEGILSCPEPGKFVLERGRDKNWGLYWTSKEVSGDFPIAFVLPISEHGKGSFCPRWFFEKYRDSGIIDTKDTPVWNGWFNRLALNHPAVRPMIKEFLTEACSTYPKEANVLLYTTEWEGTYCQQDSSKRGGYSEADAKAFRAAMENKFKTIENLNGAWKTNYKGFNEINAPEPLPWWGQPPVSSRVKATPLTYEYEKFRQETWTSWFEFCYQQAKNADPLRPVAIDPEGATAFEGRSGFDIYQQGLRACDILSTHYGDRGIGPNPYSEMDTWSARVVTGKTGGSLEWFLSTPESFESPPEKVIRAAGIRNLWLCTAWDRQIISLYGAEDTWAPVGAEKPVSGDNLCDFKTDYSCLRPGAGGVRATFRQLRGLSPIFEKTRIVNPPLAVLKPSTSSLNAYPHGGPQLACWVVLYGGGIGAEYPFRFIFEERLLEGKDTLDSYKALILPYATHFPPGLWEKIRLFVRNGGLLIALGPFGIYDQYGFDDGTAMKEIFGPLELSYNGAGESLEWNVKKDGEKENILIKNFGKGKIVMTSDGNEFSGETGKEALCNLLKECYQREVVCEPLVWHVLRKDEQGTRYLVVINPDAGNSVSTKVTLSEPFSEVVDITIGSGCRVPLNSNREFSVFLAPGQATLLKIKLF